MTQMSPSPNERFLEIIPNLRLTGDPDQDVYVCYDNMRFDLWIGDGKLAMVREAYVDIWGAAPTTPEEMRRRLNEMMTPEFAQQFLHEVEDLPTEDVTAEGVLTVARVEQFGHWYDAQEDARRNAARKGQQTKRKYPSPSDIRNVKNQDDARRLLKDAGVLPLRTGGEEQRRNSVPAGLLAKILVPAAGFGALVFVLSGYLGDMAIDKAEEMMTPLPAVQSQQTLNAAALREAMIARGEIPANTSIAIFNTVRLSDGDPEMTDDEIAQLKAIMSKVEVGSGSKVDQ